MKHEPDPDKPENDLGFLLWQIIMTWQRQLNRALDEIDLTHTQFAIISALRSLLKESNAVTQKDIAERSNTDTMMVSKLLRTLEKKGFIERKEHKTDTRAKCVFLTSKGINTFEKAFKITSAANRDFLSKLSDKNMFIRELQGIVRIDKIFNK